MESKNDIRLPHASAPLDYGDFLDKVLVALYRLGKPSNSKEIQGNDSGLTDEVSVGRGATYLVYLGLANEKGGKGKFEPSVVGRNIAVERLQGRGEKANESWKDVLAHTTLYHQIRNYANERGEDVKGSATGLGEYLRGLSKERADRVLAKEEGMRVCKLFQSKGLLDYDETNDLISLPRRSAKPSQLPEGTQRGQGQPPLSSQTPFAVTTTISIEIDANTKDDKSVSNLIDVIRALRGEHVERAKDTTGET